MADIYGKIPIVPHLYFTTFLDDDYSPDRITSFYMGAQLMKYCSEMWIFCNELSDGMVKEIKEAQELGLPLKFFNRERTELNEDNYLLHSEIGPAYRRLIARNYGDSFGLGGYTESPREQEGTGSKADSAGSTDNKHDIGAAVTKNTGSIRQKIRRIFK